MEKLPVSQVHFHIPLWHACHRRSDLGLPKNSMSEVAAEQFSRPNFPTFCFTSTDGLSYIIILKCLRYGDEIFQYIMARCRRHSDIGRQAVLPSVQIPTSCCEAAARRRSSVTVFIRHVLLDSFGVWEIAWADFMIPLGKWSKCFRLSLRSISK